MISHMPSSQPAQYPKDRPMGKRIAKDLWSRYGDSFKQMGRDAVNQVVENETMGETESVTFWAKDAIGQLCRDNARDGRPMAKQVNDGPLDVTVSEPVLKGRAPRMGPDGKSELGEETPKRGKITRKKQRDPSGAKK